MAIKSSGIKLKMSKIFGYTLIDYKSLNLQIKIKKIKNNFSSIINEVSNPLYKRASIDTVSFDFRFSCYSILILYILIQFYV